MIGQMRYRVKIQNWEVVEQPGGGGGGQWTDELTTWANVKPLKSKRVVISDKVVMSNGYKIVLRWADGRILDKKRRIVYNGQNLTIDGVIVVDEQKRFYELTCLVNE